MPDTHATRLTQHDVADLADHLHCDLCHRYDTTARAYETPELDDGRKQLLYENICRFVLWNRRRLGVLQQHHYRVAADGNFPSELAAMLFEQPSQVPAGFSHGIDVTELRHLHSMYVATIGHLKQAAITGGSWKALPGRSRAADMQEGWCPS